MLHAYGGHILRVDLTSGRIVREKCDSQYLLGTIGGRGLNSTRLFDELPRAIDPLSPDNMLLISVGPLTGTILPASADVTISGKSPLTGILGDDAGGGFFGPELKYAGYDQVIITGRAQKPCYLLIGNEQVEIRDATALWGRDTQDTINTIRRQLGDNATQVAAIGPAGENLVKFATVVSNQAHLCGRSGMGCLFGSKQLKAIAVRGTGRLTVANPLKFPYFCREIDRAILAHPEFERRKALGSTRLVKTLNDLGMLPTRHFQQGVCAWVDQVSGETLAEKYKVKPKSCFNCPLHCRGYCLWDQSEGHRPGYESLCGYSTRIGVDDLQFVLRANAYLIRMGLDPVSSAECVAWAMECLQHGLLTNADLDGLELSWGATIAVEKLLDLIVHRQGVGNLFAEGVRRLAAHFGRGTKPYALQVKGLEIPGIDPRGGNAFALTYAIASRGADYRRAEPFLELAEPDNTLAKRWGIGAISGRFADSGKAELVMQSERQALLAACLTMCGHIGTGMGLIDLEMATDLLTTATGMGFFKIRLRETLDAIIDKERQLNLDCGIDAAQDTLPARFTGEPLDEGPSKGHTVSLDPLVQQYYQLRGWDRQGRPPAAEES